MSQDANTCSRRVSSWEETYTTLVPRGVFSDREIIYATTSPLPHFEFGAGPNPYPLRLGLIKISAEGKKVSSFRNFFPRSNFPASGDPFKPLKIRCETPEKGFHPFLFGFLNTVKITLTFCALYTCRGVIFSGARSALFFPFVIQSNFRFYKSLLCQCKTFLEFRAFFISVSAALSLVSSKRRKKNT